MASERYYSNLAKVFRKMNMRLKRQEIKESVVVHEEHGGEKNIKEED